MIRSRFPAIVRASSLPVFFAAGGGAGNAGAVVRPQVVVTAEGGQAAPAATPVAGPRAFARTAA